MGDRESSRAREKNSRSLPRLLVSAISDSIGRNEATDDVAIMDDQGWFFLCLFFSKNDHLKIHLIDQCTYMHIYFLSTCTYTYFLASVNCLGFKYTDGQCSTRGYSV